MKKEWNIYECIALAKPGNFFWRKAEELQGYDGDYSPIDAGNQ